MRNTLAKPITMTGVGIHSGQQVRTSVRPAPAGHGLRINGTPVRVDAVVDSALSTTLQTARGPVRTVEHLLAALAGAAIDDADIEAEGEIPILDGSAAPWFERIQGVAQPGVPTVIEVDAVHRVGNAESWVEARPGPFQLAVDVDFPGVGRQRFAPTDFSEYADARTFGYLADAERLRAAGLALGASHENTLVLDAGRPLTPLRHADELARHKCLDLRGDLALLNARLRAHVTAHRAGHALHHALVRLICAAHAAKRR